MTRKTYSAVTPEKIGRIMHVARKHRGYSQVQVAKELGVEQSAYSRIESGIQGLTTPQWFQFCDLTGILPDSLRTGYVEFLQPISTRDEQRESYFKLPAEFQNHRGSTVRAMLPFLGFFEANLGKKKLTQYLESRKLDPDFFLNLSNQLNLNFCLEISRTLIREGKLSRANTESLTSLVKDPKLHGNLRYRYDGIERPLDLLNSLVFNARYYECNFKYEIEDRTAQSLDISVAPESHLSDFAYRDDSELGDFLCRYKQSYFKKFATYGGAKEVTITESECHYKKQRAHRCLYRVQAKA